MLVKGAPVDIPKTQVFLIFQLTHWSLRDVKVNLKVYFLRLILQIYVLSTTCEVGRRWVPQNSIDENIGSANGLVPWGNKPLLEPMLSKICVAIVSLGISELSIVVYLMYLLLVLYTCLYKYFDGTIFLFSCRIFRIDLSWPILPRCRCCFWRHLIGCGRLPWQHARRCDSLQSADFNCH